MDSIVRRNLRTILVEDSECSRLFYEAEALANGLFDKAAGARTTVPFFTPHDIEHVRRVEKIVNDILFGTEDRPYRLEQTSSLMLSPEEAMYLLAAIWLHDIGMLVGALPRDLVGPDASCNEIRDTHELRSAEYILSEWKLNCSWQNNQRTHLAELCVYHRRKHPLDKMDPPIAKGRGEKPIRLRELASLVRLADAFDVGPTRAPADLRAAYEVIGMPIQSVEHWGVSSLVERIAFNHEEKEINIEFLLPARKQAGSAIIDLELVCKSLVWNLRDELGGVTAYLNRYNNTCFETVHVETHHPKVLDQAHLLFLSVWPYLLTTSFSASQTASILCFLVRALLLAHYAQPVPKREIERMLDYATQMHPHNQLVFALAKNIREQLDSGTPALVQYLNSYEVAREGECRRVAAEAAQIIKPNKNDPIIIYDYSHTVFSFLLNQLAGHEGEIIVAECRRRRKGIPYSPNEAFEMVKSLRNNGFTKVRYAAFAALPMLFQNYKTQGKRPIVLIGATAILADGTVIVGVGNTMVAMAAKAHSVDVFVLAEPAKHSVSTRESYEIDYGLEEAAVFPTRNTDECIEELFPRVDLLNIGTTFTRLICPGTDVWPEPRV